LLLIGTEHQINILEQFLKDHVTLKTEVMATTKYLHEILFFKLYYYLDCLCEQMDRLNFDWIVNRLVPIVQVRHQFNGINDIPYFI